MAKSNAVAEVQDSGLPSLYKSESFNDLGLSPVLDPPKMYLMQPLSTLVGDGVATPGDVVIADSKDDPGAQFVIGGDSGRDNADVYILDRERIVIYSDGDEFRYLPKDTIIERGNPEHEHVWEGFNYLVAIPEVDETFPVKWMLVKTGGRFVFRALNTYLAKHVGLGKSGPVVVNISVDTKVNRKQQKYFVYKVKQVEGTPEGHAVAGRFIEQGASLSMGRRETHDLPAGETSGF